MTHTVVVRAPEVRTSFVVRGIPGPAGPGGAPGPAGAGLHITGTLPDVSALPVTAATGDAYLIAGELHIWGGAAWTNAGFI